MTERHVETEAPLACSAETARDLLVTNPTDVFAPTHPPGVERRTFPVTLRVSSSTGATVMHQVTVALGMPATATGSRFPITWSPATHRRVLPSFHGALEIVSEGDDACLRIVGSYRAPLGAAGKLVDAMAGQRVARQSIQDLTTFAASRLGECARERESAVGWHPAPYAESLMDRPPPEAHLG